jgi:anti-sigma B factor antagonist
LILDLSGLEFMDSTGLRCILTCDAEARRDPFTIALIPGPPAVQRVFELTNTRTHLPFIDP